MSGLHLGIVASSASTASTAWTLDNVTKPFYQDGFQFLDTSADGTPIERTLRGLYVKSDGTELYCVGQQSDIIIQYTLSTAYDLNTATRTGYVDISANSSLTYPMTGPHDLFFKPDGTMVFVTGQNGTTYQVTSYELSTAWDITTLDDFATPTQLDLTSVTTSDSVDFRGLGGVTLSDDGTKMYISCSFADEVFEYELSTAWDLSTASFSYELDVVSQTPTPYSLDFNSSGTKMDIFHYTHFVYHYTLSTAWDLSTASYDSVSTDNTVLFEDVIHGADWGNSGGYYFTSSNEGIFRWNTGTAYNINSLSIDCTSNHAVNFAALQTGASQSVTTYHGASFGNNGAKLYMTSTGGGYDEYDLSTAYNIGTASWSHRKSNLITSTNVNRGPLVFKSDGTKALSVIFDHSNLWGRLYEFTFSTAWDLSTITVSQYADITTQTKDCIGISVSPDGTKVFVTGDSENAIFRYDLSTAWDVSTASFAQSYSGNNQFQPFFIQLSANGKKMLSTRSGSQTLYEYDLSTAWDVTSINAQGFVSYIVNSPFRNGGSLLGMGMDSTGDRLVLTQSDKFAFTYNLT